MGELMKQMMIERFLNYDYISIEINSKKKLILLQICLKKYKIYTYSIMYEYLTALR